MALPECEGAARAWVRATNSTAGQRVYFAMPQQDRPELPCVVLYRVGGIPDWHGQDYPDLVLECWGATKHEASALASFLANEVEQSNHKSPVILDGVKVMAGSVNFGPVPNGGTDWAKRYRLDVSFHMRAVSP